MFVIAVHARHAASTFHLALLSLLAPALEVTATTSKDWCTVILTLRTSWTFGPRTFVWGVSIDALDAIHARVFTYLDLLFIASRLCTPWMAMCMLI
jgi:hypothetical protein